MSLLVDDCCLRIAGMDIQIHAVGKQQLLIESGYVPFLISGIAEPSITVCCHAGFPSAVPEDLQQIYAAATDEALLWDISKFQEGYLLRAYEADGAHSLQQVCIIDHTFSHWDVHLNPQQENGKQILVPLAYPLGPLIMYHLTLKHDAIMIHASGIDDDGRGRIFTGVSGNGKSTMALLWFDAGAQVLNDDRLIVRKEVDGYTVHNTPMFYADEPKSARLSSIHLIRHAESNVSEVMTGAEAVASISANCIQHGYNRIAIEHHLSFLSTMLEYVEVFRTGFVPDSSVIDHIRHAYR